jgi:hypothetical protein
MDTKVGNKSSVVNVDTVRCIRRALNVGLSSFGEIERLDDTYSSYELLKADIPGSLRPIHPTGANNTIGEFAEAYALLDLIESEIEDEKA